VRVDFTFFRFAALASNNRNPVENGDFAVSLLIPITETLPEPQSEPEELKDFEGENETEEEEEDDRDGEKNEVIERGGLE